MGRVVRFPLRTADVTRAVERLTEELERDRTVVDAFAAVDRGDFDAQAVRDVINGRAGSHDDYVALCERIQLVARVRRSCGVGGGGAVCCTERCERWPHCAGGPEGI